MEHAFRALNQHFKPDLPGRQADVLLNLCEQTIGEKHIGGFLYLGQNNNIDLLAGGLYHFDQIAIEEFSVNAIGTEGTDFAAEVECLESFNQRLARGDLLRRSAAVFQIEDHLVGVAGSGFGHHLARVRGAGQLAAANGDHRLISASQRLDELIIEIHTVIKIFHADPLILPVSTRVVHVFKNAGDTVRRDPADAQVFAVARAGIHDRNYRQAAVEFVAERLKLADNR